MMASNLISRFLPGNQPARSIYEDLRAHDEASESDIEEQAGLALDEENLHFHDDQLGNAAEYDGESSRITTESAAFLERQQQAPLGSVDRKGKAPVERSNWEAQSPRLLEEDGDDDVPASLLIEDHGPNILEQEGAGARKLPPTDSPIPGDATRQARARWETAQAQQRLHTDADPRAPPHSIRSRSGPLTGSPKDRAMWRWVNVTNLDNFINEVYDYYMGAGIWCMVLDKVIDLL